MSDVKLSAEAQTALGLMIQTNGTVAESAADSPEYKELAGHGCVEHSASIGGLRTTEKGREWSRQDIARKRAARKAENG